MKTTKAAPALMRETAKEACMAPRRFFAAQRKGEGMRDAARYMLVLGAPFAILSTIANYLLSPETYAPYADAMPVALAVQMAIAYIFLITLFYLEAGMAHLLAAALGGKGRYPDTFRAIVYGDTPSLLVGWIPVIGMTAYVYGIVLQTIGMATMHRLSTARAAVSILVPVAVMLGLAYLGVRALGVM